MGFISKSRVTGIGRGVEGCVGVSRQPFLNIEKWLQTGKERCKGQHVRM